MERIKALIEKLHHQQTQNVSLEQLLVTVQLLQAEIVQSQQKSTRLGTAKVAVTLPVNHVARQEKEVYRLKEDHEDIPSVSYNQDTAAKPVVKKPVEVLEEKHAPYVLRRPQVVEEVFVKKEAPQPAPKPVNIFASFEAAEEAPTLVQHLPAKEVHEQISIRSESLNDRLKEEKIELMHKLNESPVKDLRKAIGINDRFTFINELFRGDEAMYERSIKTINNFGIYSEAEFWISRELKLKLAWNDDRDIVQHFYQLVRRRFS